ncbi:porin [Pelomonas sp. KK5]|uniref:porin n=1 Tax=Pelomonas sp. KK5 TaxID=1855730 RepID=UPI00097CA4E5|nr:porin [Pelomonas sp. KK5]
MNKTFQPLAAACMLAVPLLASAQSSVTVYGIADALVEYRNHMNAAGDSRVAVTSGGLNTSRWGLRGVEDLGGGLKAVFNLEGEVGFDTGAAGSSFWGRQATVGLQGDFGRIVAGRSYTTAYDFILPFDPMGYAPFYSWATSAGAAGTRKDGMLTAASNLIKYDGKFGPVKLGASVAAGEGAATGRYAALAAGYDLDAFSAVLVLDQRDRQTGAVSKEQTVHWGLSYDMKPVKFFLAQRQYKKTPTSGAEQKSTLTWVGATWSVTPVLDLTPAYYFQNVKTGPLTPDDPHLLALRAKYALSKRTWLYAVASNAKARSGVVSVSRDDAAFADTQSSFGVGIQHRF